MKKKHWTMRVGVALLALTLITSCFVSGTWAKYVTSGTGSDTARVAKFGVTVTAEGETFATQYNSGQSEYKDAVVVRSGTVDKVVAPGTYGNVSVIKLTGTPEVSVKVSYEATEFELGDNWVDKDGEYYCPLEFTVRSDSDNGTAVLKGADYTSADEFETAVKNAIKTYSTTYEPGTDLTVANAQTLTVYWAWAFTGNDDVKDTYLGDRVAENEAATISLTVTTTVAQVD